MYCDYAATTPPADCIKDNIGEILEKFGNPSSTYSLGDETRMIVETTRQRVKKFINAQEDSIVVFTPSGSGSNTLAVEGYLYSRYAMMYYSPLLHKSLNKYREGLFDSFGGRLEVNSKGFIDLVAFKNKLEERSGIEGNNPPLLVIEYANSEIGTLQVVKEAIKLIHSVNGIAYVDCTGAIASILIDVQDLGADMIGFSAHKLGALKGCGVLWMRKNFYLKPLVYGAQENGLVGGTENVLGIWALGKVLENYEYHTLTPEIRRSIFKRIERNGWHLIGSERRRLPNNFYFSIPTMDATELMTRLDLYEDVQVSTGSACSSGSREPSSSLLAINCPEEWLHSCIRVTFGGKETAEEVNGVFDAIERTVAKMEGKTHEEMYDAFS
jgi:cysteine desulfurase